MGEYKVQVTAMPAQIQKVLEEVRSKKIDQAKELKPIAGGALPAIPAEPIDQDYKMQISGGLAGATFTGPGIGSVTLTKDQIAVAYYDGKAKTWSVVNKMDLPKGDVKNEAGQSKIDPISQKFATDIKVDVQEVKEVVNKNEDSHYIQRLVDNDGTILLEFDKNKNATLLGRDLLAIIDQNFLTDNVSSRNKKSSFEFLDRNGNIVLMLDSENNPYVGDIDLRQLVLSTQSISKKLYEISERINSNIKEEVITYLPSNSNSTTETRNLFFNLNAVGKSLQVALGHQSTNTLTFQGFESIYKSDVKDVVNEFPAVVAYDIGGIERGLGTVWLEGTSDRIKEAAIYAHSLGCAISISWHTRNPVYPELDQKNRNSTGQVINVGNTVEQLFNDPTAMKRYVTWLDIVSEFFLSLKDAQGNLIPILFRPFHECNGNWFWWGVGHCTDDEYKNLYRFTYEYLVKSRKINNLLWIYNTDRVSSEEQYLSRFPGASIIDFFSLDFYDSSSMTLQQFEETLSASMSVMFNVSHRYKKGCFLAEVGKVNYDDHNYWTSRASNFFDPRLIYVSFWTNTPANYYMTHLTDPAKEDFISFTSKQDILLENQIKQLNIYQ